MSIVNFNFFLVVFFICNVIPVSLVAESNMVPKSIVSLSDDYTSLIFVEKESQKLHLYEKKSGEIRKLNTFSCSTGEIKGRKQLDGDKKTPDGVYFFQKKYIDKYLAPIYGSGAFTTDYPNILDTLNQRTGSAIWLHGTNKNLKPYDSNGCVAIENQNLDYLSGYLELHKTPVILSEKMIFVQSSEQQRIKKKVLGFMEHVLHVINKGTYKDYVELYDTQFAPDIYWWNQWVNIRESGQSDMNFGVEFEHLNIYNHDTIYIVTYEQNLKTDQSESFAGVQKIYLTETGNELKILCEELLKPPDMYDPEKYNNALVATGITLKDEIEKIARKNEKDLMERMIISKVDYWLEAWQSSDFSAYSECYSKDFLSRGMNKVTWIKRKKYLSSMYDYIKISKQDLTLAKMDDRAVIVFTQHYKSNNFSETGKKKLYLKLEEGEWKIYKESWKKS